jgi:hypothetical protein
MVAAGGRNLKFQIILTLGISALPAFAQYAGPAILSRGDAPSALMNTQISFRPYFEFNAIYDTGLSSGVGANSQGELGTTSSEGVQIAGGISGSHVWRHTQIGLDYHADYNHFSANTSNDNTDQFFGLAITHQFSRHLSLTLRNTGALFDRSYGVISLNQTLPYDLSQTTLPTTDFFDNRTFYLSTEAQLIYRRSARLSFSLSSSGYINRRRSTALYGLTGANASGDVQYRLSRRSTVGVNYRYEHYSFTRIFSSSDLHSFAGVYSIQLNKSMEFSGYAGITRAETVFTQNVPVDPLITALFGIRSAESVAYSIRNIPNINGRLSRIVHNGIISLNAGHLVTPGNGLFLTSASTNVNLAYTYTGLRRWSFAVSGDYNKSSSFGNIVGTYGNAGGTLSASRQLIHNFHMVIGAGGNRYISSTFTNYNRPIYNFHFGIGWSPGDVPLRVW